MSTPLIEAKIGQGLLVVCSPQPRCVSPTDQSTVPSCLVREPPLSYRAPESQVTDLGRGRWRQWLSFPPQHHSARANCATQMSFGLWLLSLIFSSPTVWSFLPAQTADPWKIRHSLIWELLPIPEGTKSSCHCSPSYLWGQVLPLLSPLHIPVSFPLTPEGSTLQLRQPFSHTTPSPSPYPESQVLVTVAGTLRLCTKSWGHSQT